MTTDSTDTDLTIANNRIAEIHYQLNDDKGNELESTKGSPPKAFLVGHRGVLAGLEEALLGHKAGDKVDVSLPPERAFGCLLYTSPSPRDRTRSRMPSSA